MAERLRAFIAIELPQEVKEYLKFIQQGLKTDLRNIRWVKPENIHLTIKFLGDIDNSMVKPIIELIDQSAARTNTLQLEVKGLGVFPTIKRPRVLWAGTGGNTPGVLAFHQDLDNRLAGIGIKKETKRFRAHLTLGRMKGAVRSQSIIEAMDRVAKEAPLPFEVRRINLFQSKLRPDGAVYSVLHRAELPTI